MEKPTFLTRLRDIFAKPHDFVLDDLRDGYCRLKTEGYTLEIPRGWRISKKSPSGQRQFIPKRGTGKLGVQIVSAVNRTWDQLYQTALGDILAEQRGRSTPYRLTKSRTGDDCASFEVLNDDGFPARRFVMTRNSANELMVLSVWIPNRAEEAQWTEHFQRLMLSIKTSRSSDQIPASV